MNLLKKITLGVLLAVVTFGCSNTKSAQSKPSLDVQIGQMLLVGFRGLEVDGKSKIVKDIKKYHLGGILLYDYDVLLKKPNRNIKTAEQVHTLIQSLQKASDIPLFIAIDEEGGRIQRLKPEYGFQQRLSHKELGDKGDIKLTLEESKKIGAGLAHLGINMNFAPVVDINMNPESSVIGKKERCFSDDPGKVAKHALAYIQGQHEEGIVCSLKHFPGHGSATADSHYGFTDITDTWNVDELDPFAAIIRTGEADMVMTAHVFNQKLDEAYPATLSRFVLTDLLRNNLKFKGIIISDDIQMQAISDHYGFEESVIKTIQAGADIVLIANQIGFDEKAVEKAAKAIKKAVKSGAISETRINESFERIQTLKEKLG